MLFLVHISTDTRMAFNVDPTTAKEKYTQPSDVLPQSLKSEKERLEDGALVAEVENAVHEEMSGFERLSRRVTLQLMRWGLEVNG